MQLQVLIGAALLSIATGLPLDNVTINALSIPPEDIKFIQQNELYVYDDNMKPVRLTWNPNEEAAGESDTEVFLNIKERVTFYLYTKRNPSNPQRLAFSDKSSLRSSNFDAKKPTRIVTHGWMNTYRFLSCQLIRKEYLRQGDYNVIAVDWSRISQRPYSFSYRHVITVGKHIAKMIDFLQTQGMDLSQTTLIGHSLGAHVAGLAAYYAKGTVNYVNGLDPALPGFSRASHGQRISTESAKHVEIIHTNGGLLGYLSAIGHSDFYPNGGSRQRGCIIDIGGVCSHIRACQLFAESITSSVGFYGKKCHSYLAFKQGKCDKGMSALMGERKAIFLASGSYYLETNVNPPFAKGR